MVLGTVRSRLFSAGLTDGLGFGLGNTDAGDAATGIGQVHPKRSARHIVIHHQCRSPHPLGIFPLLREGQLTAGDK